ncbi:MAG: ABC transporter ATP-binding protein/permease [Firmicutes bacterium]|nr:ABC transporter ATP-binding protein/permease [Bacillota bacterium]
MRIFFRYLKPFALLVTLAIALLGAQAAAELAMPSLMSDIVDKGLLGGQRELIFTVGAKMILLTLGTGLAAACVGLLSARTAAGFSRNLRRAVFTKVQSFSKAEIDKFSIASLITRSTNDVQHVQMFVLTAIRMMVFAPIMGVGGLTMALRKSPSLSWIIALALVIMVCALVLVLLIVMPRFKVLQKLIDRLNLVSRENLTGLMVIRAFGNEAHEEQRFERAARDLAKTERFLNRSMALLMPMMMLLMNGMSMLVVWFGGKGIASGALQIGDMMAFIQYSMNIVFSFVFIGMMFVMLPRAAVSAGRIREVLETKVTVNDTEKTLEIPEGPVEVRFDSVHFRYEGAEEDVLSDISFAAKPGQTTAFIGATGAGKSTLINLIERFYDVTGGSILFNGVDIRDVPQAALRQKIGFVPQSAVLFSGTVRSNVNYEGEALPDEAVFEALRTAQGEDFVREQEDGLEARVAQDGANFSGGQKQRLSIARALAWRPGVYIFDDSFSALDFKTDAALRRALKARTADATVFIVAQRASTIMRAEQIVVLDQGGVAGIGTHEELLQTCEVYREIAESQLSKEEL